MLWLKKVHLGVDLGSHAVKVSTVDSGGASCHVSQLPLMPDRANKEEALTGPALAERVKAIVNDLRGKGKPKVHLSVEGPTLATGYLELPRLSVEQQKVAVPTAVAREIPHPLHDVHLYPVPVPALHDASKQGIFFIAVPKATYEARTSIFATAGFEVADCEPGLLATVRGVIRNREAMGAEEAVAVVSCGFRTTSVILLRGGHPYFSRDFRIAGSDFTYAFQMGDQVDWAEGERRKLEYDVAERDFKVESFIERWLSDIQRSLTFAAQKHSRLVPGRVIMTGGSSLWKGLPDRLSEFLKLPVERQQWGKLKPAADSGASEIVFYDQALGLVSRS